MAKRQDFIGGMGTANLLSDQDWVTVIAALLRDASPGSRRLARVLLAKTKQGREIRLVRLIQTRRPNTTQMQKALKMSRRTIFRYLNGLEDYGILLTIDERFRYEIVHMPDSFKKLMPRIRL